MCVEAIVARGDKRSYPNNCGELCRILEIRLSDLPQLRLENADGKAVIGFDANECFCWVDFDALAAAHGFAVKHGPMEVTLTGPPVSDAKYRAWLATR